MLVPETILFELSNGVTRPAAIRKRFPARCGRFLLFEGGKQWQEQMMR